MFAYNIGIALRSLRRNPLLTAVIVGGIALGICASTTFTTVRHMYARDPLPGRSDRLFYVRMDNWDPSSPYPFAAGDGSRIPTQISYRDAVGLMQRSSIPVRQTASFQTALTVYPESKTLRPYSTSVRAVGSDFFAMFQVPFQYGSGWDRTAESRAEQVVVIDYATNEKIFGGGNSVGRTIRAGDRAFKVVGVLTPWRPFLKMYDLVPLHWAMPPESMFIPFALTPSMKLRTTGDSDAWSPVGPTYDEFLQSDVDWVQLWVELRSPSDRAAYLRYVNDYVRGEKQHGRFARPLNDSVASMREMMQIYGVVRPQITAMAAMSVLFLVICSLNLAGLLLGKFLARAPEVSVRRALGATRADVFLQHITECEIVGLAGGVIGMLLSIGMLQLISRVLTFGAALSLDGEMVASAIFLSLIAGFIAGLYPAWRICTLQPAIQLKV